MSCRSAKSGQVRMASTGARRAAAPRKDLIWKGYSFSGLRAQDFERFFHDRVFFQLLLLRLLTRRDRDRIAVVVEFDLAIGVGNRRAGHHSVILNRLIAL